MLSPIRMNRPPEIWQFILEQKQQHKEVMLLYVLESKGSSPGRQGFFMAVTAQGLMKGSIGGGVMEHKFVELAKKKLEEQAHESSLRKQVHDAQAAKNRSGMICSGEQTIFMYTIQAADIPPIASIITSMQEPGKASMQLSPAGIIFQPDSQVKNTEFIFHTDTNWLYQETIGFKNQLYIIGGGHCALAFSKIMRMMDFYIHLYEDRPSLNTFEENKYVHEKSLVNNYSELNELIPPGKASYVVVMTFGYRTDDLVVRALLKKDFAYFGLLGSAAKIAKMFADYRREGIPETELRKIYAPVGLPISSQTPEEIAISIAAEIIQVKNEKITTCSVIKNKAQ